MSYYLEFALNLTFEDELIIYKPDVFVGKPIQIDVPEVMGWIEDLVHSFPFREYGVVEKKNKKTRSSASSREGSKKQLKPISSKAHVCPAKELNQEALNQLTSKMISYLQKLGTELTPENVFFAESGIHFSALVEVVNIRNYFNQFLNSSIKAYQNGYLQISRV